MGVFPLQHTRLFLRYRHHFDEKRLLTELKKNLESGTRQITDYCIVQDETDEDMSINEDMKRLLGVEDEDNKFLHTHVFIKADKIFKNTSNKAFIIEGVTPYIVKITSNDYEKKVIAYCFSKRRKPETNIENPSIIVRKDKSNDKKKESIRGKEMKDIRAKVYSCKSEQDVLDQFEEESVAGDINLLISIWKTKPRDPKPPGKPTDNWFGWKIELKEEIMENPIDDRKIIWYTDYLGMGGKSDFVDYMVDHVEGVVSFGADSIYHLSTTIIGSIRNEGEFHTIIFDIPADGSVSNGFYEAIEMIKNGKFTSKKYNGQPVKIKKPNIIIFCNQLPHLWKVSPDRWDLRILDTDRKIFHRVIGNDLRERLVKSGESKYDFCTKYIENEIPIKNKEYVRIKG